jgi:hypothetical protein
MSKSSGSKGRGRNRNNGGKRPQGRGGNYDPNMGRNRGNAQQLMDKYLSLARDAASQGDRIAAENYFQHADHYYRIVHARNEQQEARRRANGQEGNDSSSDPIPVQGGDKSQGPVDLMEGDGDESGEKLDGDATSEGPADDPKPRKPRRGRPPKKSSEADESSATEAAE